MSSCIFVFGKFLFLSKFLHTWQMEESRSLYSPPTSMPSSPRNLTTKAADGHANCTFPSQRCECSCGRSVVVTAPLAGCCGFVRADEDAADTRKSTRSSVEWCFLKNAKMQKYGSFLRQNKLVFL